MSLSYYIVKFIDRTKIFFSENGKNLFLIILVGILLRAPLLGTPFWRTNDAMEYINVARNINSGLGMTQSIKFILADPSPVVSSALRSRPPLTSLLLAGLLKIVDNLFFLQAFNLFLGILNALLVYFLARQFARPALSLLGGILSVTNPNALITGRLVLSDQLFASFPLLAAIVFYTIKNERLKAALLGICCGLLVLTRLEGLALLAVLLIYFRHSSKTLVILIATFLVVTAPYFLANWQVNGSPLFTKNVLHYQVFDIREALEGGFERQFPTPVQFISQNFSWVVTKVAQTTYLNFASLFELGYFGPLILLLIVALKQLWRKYLIWIFFCAVVFGLYCSLWSSTFERSRNFIFIYLLLLPLLIEFLQKNLKRPLVKLLLVITFAGYLVLDVHRIVWARNVDSQVSVWDRASKQEIFFWIKSNTSADAIIASTNVFMVNLQTGRPSITVPTNLSPENVARFVKKYQVAYFLLLIGDCSDFLGVNVQPVANFTDGKIYSIQQ